MKGFVSLISVIILGAVAITIAISILTYGVLSTQNSQTLIQSYQARGLADACTEVALKDIAQSSTYSGNGNLTIGQGTCTYAVTIVNGTTDRVSATSTIGSVVRKITTGALPAATRMNGFIGLSGWQEGP